MKRLASIVLTASLLASMTASSRARAEGGAADLAAAEALFDDGVKLMRAKRYADACPKLAESLRLDPGIGTMMWLADCEEKTGRTASAWARFREAAYTAEKQNDARARLAREKAAAIEPRLSKLLVVVPHAAEALVVTRDREPVGRATWGTELPIDPGTHTIEASAPGRAAWTTTVTIAPGARVTTVTVPELASAAPEPVAAAQPAPASPVSPPENDATRARDRATAARTIDPAADDAHPRTPGRAQRLAGISVAGLGVAATIAGGVFGVLAKVKLVESSAHCANNVCDPIGGDDRSAARDAATKSTVLFAAGLGAVAGGALLFFTAPRAVPVDVQPSVGPRAAGLDVRVRF